MNLSRRFASETFGTVLLLATVVGSGIMGDRPASGNVVAALLANNNCHRRLSKRIFKPRLITMRFPVLLGNPIAA